MENKTDVNVLKRAMQTVGTYSGIRIVFVYILIWHVAHFILCAIFNMMDASFFNERGSANFVFCIASFFILPFTYGLSVFYLHAVRKEQPKFSMLFSAFNDFKRISGTLYLTDIYIFLWSLLLIIPGIVRHYDYAMVPFLLYDEPDLKYKKALERSKQMMNGYKSDLFGWDILLLGAFIIIVWLGLFLFMTGSLAFNNVNKHILFLLCGLIGLLTINLMISNALYAAFYEKLKKEHSKDE